MQKPEASSTQPPALLCRYCGHELRRGGTFCTECERFQTWISQVRAEINLSALISIIPVLSLAYAFVKTNVVTPYSSVQFTVIDCTRTHVKVALSNSGSRPAVVIEGSAELVKQDPDEQ